MKHQRALLFGIIAAVILIVIAVPVGSWIAASRFHGPIFYCQENEQFRSEQQISETKGKGLEILFPAALTYTKGGATEPILKTDTLHKPIFLSEDNGKIRYVIREIHRHNGRHDEFPIDAHQGEALYCYDSDTNQTTTERETGKGEIILYADESRTVLFQTDSSTVTVMNENGKPETVSVPPHQDYIRFTIEKDGVYFNYSEEERFPVCLF